MLSSTCMFLGPLGSLLAPMVHLLFQPVELLIFDLGLVRLRLKLIKVLLRRLEFVLSTLRSLDVLLLTGLPATVSLLSFLLFLLIASFEHVGKSDKPLPEPISEARP